MHDGDGGDVMWNCLSKDGEWGDFSDARGSTVILGWGMDARTRSNVILGWGMGWRVIEEIAIIVG